MFQIGIFGPESLSVLFWLGRGNVEEEMIIPRTLEIKFGEEYSSSVYYVTICVLLFYDNAKKIL